MLEDEKIAFLETCLSNQKVSIISYQNEITRLKEMIEEQSDQIVRLLKERDSLRERNMMFRDHLNQANLDFGKASDMCKKAQDQRDVIANALTDVLKAAVNHADVLKNTLK